MGFRLRHGLNALGTLGFLVACNTYTPDLLVPADSETTSDAETSDATLTTGGGGSGSKVTTTINSITSTSASTSGGDGGGGSGSTASGNETTTDGGGSGGDSSTSSTTTETDTTNTSTSAGAGSGGSGGSGGSDTTSGGGSGGSGGSSTTGTPIDVLLIDDLEDGNNQLETPTYSGYWFTAVDESGTGDVLPVPGEQCRPENLETPRGDSERAMHVSGTWTGSDEWIAAVGFALQDDETPVDASSYTGVKFYARTDNDDTQIRLQVMVTDVDDNEDNGHYAIELEVTSEWDEYTVLWSNDLLIQPSWAIYAPLDPAHLYKFQFQFDSESFDLWIDDFRFVE